MIDVKELQVGSLVQDANNNLFIVTSLSLSICNLHRLDKPDEGSWGFDYADVYPIEVTAKWLDRFGFRQWAGKTGVWRTYVRNIADPAFALCQVQMHSYVQTNLFAYDEETTLGVGGFITTVASVHHLQNLVSALERVWLTIPESC